MLISKIVNKIDAILEEAKQASKTIYEDAFLMPLDEVKELLTFIHSTFIMEEGYGWDLEEYHAIIDYLSNEHDSERKGFVWIIARSNRNINRMDKNNKFENSPDTPKGEKGELRIAREIAEDIPALILLRQNGLKEKGWNGTPFWWPVLIAPAETTSTVFARKAVK